MIGTSTKPLNPPRVINEMMRGQWASAIVNTSMSVKLFDAVDENYMTAEEAAAKCGIQTRAAELLMNSLTGLGLMEKKGNKFKTTEEAHHYLVSNSPLCLSKMFDLRPMFMQTWGNLENVVKTGVPHSEVNKEEQAAKFFPALAAGLYAMNYAYGEQLADHLKVADKKEKYRVLDLACGSSVWTIPMAKANKNVQVDALDFQPVIEETTKKFVEMNGVKDQFKYLAGNWKEINLDEGGYDLVILGHILHSEGKEKSLEMLQYVHKALKKGGQIAVAEFLVDDARTSPASAAMFGVNMYLLTSEGCIFSHNELKEMLMQSGFSNVRNLPKDERDTDLIMADA